MVGDRFLKIWKKGANENFYSKRLGIDSDISTKLVLQCHSDCGFSNSGIFDHLKREGEHRDIHSAEL